MSLMCKSIGRKSILMITMAFITSFVFQTAARVNATKLTVNTKLFESTSFFEIERNKNGCSVNTEWAFPFKQYENTISITKKTCDSLFQSFEKLPTPESVPAVCSRNWITIDATGMPNGTKTSKNSCYFVSTPTSPAYDAFAKRLYKLFPEKTN